MPEPPAPPGSPRGRPRPAGRAIARVVLFAIAVRLLSAALAFLAVTAFPLDQREQFTVLGRTHRFWDPFARYDSGWYYGIARNGYRFVEGGRSNLAFFPMYPLAMRYAGRALGGRQEDYYRGGIVVSWVAFVGAMVMLHRLARLDMDEDAAWRAVVYAAVFPFAFVHGVVYSESLFLLAMVTAFLGFRTRRWALGGLAGAVAVCTRVNGVMALPALAWIAWQESGGDRRARLRALLAVGAVVAGFAAWCAYVHALSGSWLEWMRSIERWGYYPGQSPWTPFAGLVQALATRPYAFLSGERMAPYDTLNGLSALVVLAAVPLIWRRLGTGYALFVLANLALPLSSAQFEGLGRYCAVLFPFFLLLATIRSQALHSWLVYAMSAVYMLCLALFSTIHPLF